jgi:Cu/Zn superoxide dismutase
MIIPQNGSRFSVTATHATSAVATQAAASEVTHYITDISGSSDKAGALLLVKQETTVIWQVQLATTAAGSNAFHHSFVTPLSGANGASVSVTVDGTSACYSNIAGFYL